MGHALRMMKLDVLCMKPYLKSYLMLFFIAAAVSLANRDQSMLPLPVTFYLIMMTGSIFSIQERNNLERLYGALSMNNSSIVGGRYLFNVLHALLGVAASGLMLLFFPIFKGMAIDGPLFLTGASAAFLVFNLVTSFQLPLYFRLGYTKARFVTLVPFVIPVLLIALLPALSPQSMQVMERITATLFVQPSLTAIICLALSLLALSISYRISLAMYRQARG